MNTQASQIQTAINGDYDKALFDQQIRLLYRQTLVMLAINLLVTAILVYGLAPIASHTLLAIWYEILLTVCLVWLIFFLLYRRHEKTTLSSVFFARLFIFGCMLSGASWGSASILFFHADAMQYQLLIFFVLAGMGAGSVASLCAYNPAFLAYFLTLMIPIMLRLFWEADRTNSILGILAFIFIVCLSFFALQLNRSLILSLKLRFENTHLVNKLREQKDEAEQANQAKSKFLAAASHDLRQPLHALTLYASILSDQLERPENKKLIGQINHSVDALQSLFNSLLDISKLERLFPNGRIFACDHC